MAFGDVRGTAFSVAANSITNPFVTTAGSAAVSLGDLVYCVLVQQTGLTVTAVNDDLGNTYTALNAGNDAGAVTARAFYSIVTVAGTITALSATTTASANNAVFIGVALEGPVGSLTDNPANTTSDVTTPFNCPTTGTLAAGDKIVIGWGAANYGTAWTATSPNTERVELATSTLAKGDIGSQVVSTTTAVVPVFAAAGNPTECVLGTSAFLRDASVSSLPARVDVVISGTAPTADRTVTVDLTATGLTVSAAALTEPEFGLSADIGKTPGAADLAISAAVPSTVHTTHRDIQPSAGNVALSQVAPTVFNSDLKAAAPASANVVLSPTAPTSARTAHVAVVPGVVEIALSGTAPTVARTAHHFRDVAQGNVALSAVAPIFGISVLKVAAVADLALTATAPSRTLSDNRSIAPAVAEIALSGSAPAILQTTHRNISPASANVALTTVQPAGGVGVGKDPPGKDLLLSAVAPAVAQSTHRFLTAPQGTATLTADAPAVVASTHRVITVPQVNVALSGTAPGVARSLNSLREPAARDASLSGTAPNVAQTTHRNLIPSVGQLGLSSAAPQIQSAQNFVPAAANLAFTSPAPAILQTTHRWLVPAAADVSLSATVPASLATAHHVALPAAASLELSTRPAELVPGTVIYIDDPTDLALTTSGPVLTMVRRHPWRRRTILSGSRVTGTTRQGQVANAHSVAGEFEQEQLLEAG